MMFGIEPPNTDDCPEGREQTLQHSGWRLTDGFALDVHPPRLHGMPETPICNRIDDGAAAEFSMDAWRGNRLDR